MAQWQRRRDAAAATTGGTSEGGVSGPSLCAAGRDTEDTTHVRGRGKDCVNSARI